MVGWDVTHYAERLLRKPSKSGTKASNEREASLKWQYPPLNEVTTSMPCIIVDMQGIIMAWYLPGILTNSRQVSLFTLSNRSGKPDTSQSAMLVVQGKLLPLLGMSQGGSSWHDDPKYFRSGEGRQGSVNLSPTWFPQGHDVSASAHGIYSLAAYSESGNHATTPTDLYKL